MVRETLSLHPTSSIPPCPWAGLGWRNGLGWRRCGTHVIGRVSFDDGEFQRSYVWWVKTCYSMGLGDLFPCVQTCWGVLATSIQSRPEELLDSVSPCYCPSRSLCRFRYTVGIVALPSLLLLKTDAIADFPGRWGPVNPILWSMRFWIIGGIIDYISCMEWSIGISRFMSAPLVGGGLIVVETTCEWECDSGSWVSASWVESE